MALPCALTLRASVSPRCASLRAAQAPRRAPRAAAAPRAASGTAGVSFSSAAEAEEALLSTVQGAFAPSL